MKKVLFVIVIFVVGMAISWAISIGMIKLVTLCFGREFSLTTATGIWIAGCGVYWFFKGFFPSGKEGA